MTVTDRPEPTTTVPVMCCGPAGSPLTGAEAERLAPMLKALGDPARLRMASLIAAAPEVCVCDITPAFELSSGTISHHLRILREAGLVDCERRGTFVYYWIVPGALRSLADLLGGGTPRPEAVPAS